MDQMLWTVRFAADVEDAAAAVVDVTVVAAVVDVTVAVVDVTVVADAPDATAASAASGDEPVADAHAAALFSMK